MPAQPLTKEPAEMPRAATPTPALDRLRPAEYADVVGGLLVEHPDILAEAEEVAISRLRGVTAEDVARRVIDRLHDLDLDLLATRAGRVPGGYVEPGEAACEIVLEALEPIDADLNRCIELGLESAARTTLLGLLGGLDRCRSARDGTVLAYAGPDMLPEHGAFKLKEARRAGVDIEDDELPDTWR